tara:strand:- start:216 stop:1292 length:1077 start_codon:yes stop_codon:yes gene_type:complete
MALWVDKHRPKTLDALDHHKPLAANMKRMVASGDFPHMLFYGPSGAGKKTRVMALLRQLHGPSVEKLKVEARSFKFGSSSTTTDLTLVSSSHHVELNPSDAGIRDREVVSELIKEIAQAAPIITGGGASAAAPPFKVVVLNEVERLSKPAQHALRRTMEKYTSTCRLVLVCNNPCKVIAPIRSRCLCFRIAAPTHDEVASVLQSVANKEGLKLPSELALRISTSCERNLRRSILTLEACKVQQYPFSETQHVQLPDWQLFINAVADEVLQEQSPKQLLKVRGKLYELLSNCIPADLIMRYLTVALLKKVPVPIRHQTVHFAALFEARMQAGSKPIFHLEAFLARFMSIIKQHSTGGRR